MALSEPQQRLVALLGIRNAFRRLEVDPKWRKHISDAVAELKPTPRQMEEINAAAAEVRRELRTELDKRRVA